MKSKFINFKIAPFQQCRSLDGWQPIKIHSSSRDLVYTVFVNPWTNFEENICQCEAYMYRGHCKHQAEASEHICGWHEIDGIEQTEEQMKRQICPECGGPTMYVLENVKA